MNIVGSIIITCSVLIQNLFDFKKNLYEKLKEKMSKKENIKKFYLRSGINVNSILDNLENMIDKVIDKIKDEEVDKIEDEEVDKIEDEEVDKIEDKVNKIKDKIKNTIIKEIIKKEDKISIDINNNNNFDELIKILIYIKVLNTKISKTKENIKKYIIDYTSKEINPEEKENYSLIQKFIDQHNQGETFIEKYEKGDYQKDKNFLQDIWIDKDYNDKISIYNKINSDYVTVYRKYNYMEFGIYMLNNEKIEYKSISIYIKKFNFKIKDTTINKKILEIQNNDKKKFAFDKNKEELSVEDIYKLFKEIDKDNNNTITINELKNAIQANPNLKELFFSKFAISKDFEELMNKSLSDTVNMNNDYKAPASTPKSAAELTPESAAELTPESAAAQETIIESTLGNNFNEKSRINFEEFYVFIKQIRDDNKLHNSLYNIDPEGNKSLEYFFNWLKV